VRWRPGGAHAARAISPGSKGDNLSRVDRVQSTCAPSVRYRRTPSWGALGTRGCPDTLTRGYRLAMLAIAMILTEGRLTNIRTHASECSRLDSRCLNTEASPCDAFPA